MWRFKAADLIRVLLTVPGVQERKVLVLQGQRKMEEVRVDDLAAARCAAMAGPDGIAEAVDGTVEGELFTRGDGPDGVNLTNPRYRADSDIWVTGMVDVSFRRLQDDDAAMVNKVAESLLLRRDGRAGENGV